MLANSRRCGLGVEGLSHGRLILGQNGTKWVKVLWHSCLRCPNLSHAWDKMGQMGQSGTNGTKWDNLKISELCFF